MIVAVFLWRIKNVEFLFDLHVHVATLMLSANFVGRRTCIGRRAVFI